MGSVLGIFSGQEPAGMAVTLLIVGLLAAGLVNVRRSFRRLREERDGIKNARRALQRPDTELPQGNAADVRRFLGVGESSLLGERVARVLKLRAAGLGHREVLQELTLEQIEGFGSHARFIATVLTLLGLVGTVVGMSMAMERISAAFANGQTPQQFPELIRSLNDTLGGMKTAFACTLAGLTGSVILSALNHALRRRQSALIREIEELIVCELLPRLEMVDPEADAASRKFATVLTASAERIEGLAASLAGAAEKYETGGGRIERSAEAFTTALNAFAESVTTLTGNQQEFTRTVSETRGSIEGLKSVMQEELRRLNDFQERSNKLLGERLGALEASQKSNRDLQESIVAYNDHFKEFIASSSSQLQSACQKLLVEVSQHYKEGIRDHVDQSHKEFSALLNEHTAKLQSFSNIMLEMHVNGRASHAARGKS